MGSASIVLLARVYSGLRGPTTFRSSVRSDVHGSHNHTEFLRPDEKSRGLPPHRLISARRLSQFLVDTQTVTGPRSVSSRPPVRLASS